MSNVIFNYERIRILIKAKQVSCLDVMLACVEMF